MRQNTPVISTLVTALVVAATIAVPHAATNGRITPPPVPGDLEVPEGHRAVLIAHAYGTQNYVCLPAGSGFAWGFFGPQATLLDDDLDQVMTHYLGPNPAEGGTPRAAWQHSRDTSSVWAVAIAASSDPTFVAPGAIPWLKLQAVGAQYGPEGGRKLTATTFIQRVNTAGGIAPATGCAQATDVGKKALVPYTTDYVFYRERNAHGR
jgi:hypothetical protein